MAISSSNAVAKTSLVLRIFSLLLLGASVILMATDTVPDFFDGSTDHFTVLITYRYVVAIGIVGFLYSLAQIIFGVYYIYKEKRWIRNGCLPILDFYGDMLISFLLATATGAGFAVTYELNKYVSQVVGFGGTDKFLDRIFISIGLLFSGSICMAILSILSSKFREYTTTNRGFYFG